MLSVDFFREVIAFENRLKERSLCLCIAAADNNLEANGSHINCCVNQILIMTKLSIRMKYH